MNAVTWDFGRRGGRSWAIATVVSAAAIGILVATTLWGVTRSPTAVPVWLDVALAVISVAAVPLIMRSPVAGGLLAGVLVAVSPVATPAASFAVLLAARVRPFRQAAAVALAGAAGEAVLGLRRPIPSLPYGWWLLLMTAAYAALLGWGTWAQARQALLEALRERARRAEAEQAHRVAEARAAERTRIAREMHDVLAHRLSLLAAYAGALEYRPDAPAERLSEAAGVIRSSAHQALEELREVITLLRRNDIEAAGEADEPPGYGLADLARLVNEARAAGQRIEFEDLLGLPVDVSPLVGRTAYRIVQEALTNARKHAPGQPVALTLAGAPGAQLTIRVRNQTVHGTVTAQGSGSGLIGLAERAALAGGQVEHQIDSSGHFELTAWLPWPV